MTVAADIPLRERILTLALDRFLLPGHEQLSMRQLAGELGVTPMALYRHFQNKEDLQLHLLQAGFTRFGGYLARSEAGVTPIERLERMAEGFTAFAIENPGYFELLFLSSRTLPGLRDREAVKAVALPTYRVLLEATRACIRAGDLPPSEAHETARDVLAFCVGQAALYVSGIMNWSPEAARSAANNAFARYIMRLRSRR
ncbi:TetR/AcrR family transcriptional regulator [Caulobacter sp. BP25]|uniref:TetR/AcrR family transcriptional regulator n=1 Tax=Caulobacter sp. BP25 TaxID=2048900 RepID=UPI000C12DFD8|nr:TetR/AcrR family transcriptional regulator [Caulobacter sp. BP25]PHY22866.1 TetR family transcriptional regulator [Caulobacter sp. BP25]